MIFFSRFTSFNLFKSANFSKSASSMNNHSILHSSLNSTSNGAPIRSQSRRTKTVSRPEDCSVAVQVGFLCNRQEQRSIAWIVVDNSHSRKELFCTSALIRTTNREGDVLEG